MAKKNEKIDNNRYLITSLNPKSPISEQYRTIRTTIDFKMVDQGMKSFLVTSAEAAAGKSTTIANLAITFAQQGKRVLLIDADLRKPSVHMSFKIPNRSGLTNILTRQSTVEETLQGSPINENLAIITSGPIPPNPSELLSSAGMKNLIETMTQAFDIVLVDTPPLSAVTDAQIISGFVGGVVVVARAYQTKKESLAKTKKMLDQVQANIIGVVLHGVNTSDTAYYYYYGAE
ncbi:MULTISPECIES: polysaccharide biosynthesis tyrosine autokinase [unclassified Lactococcus]|uniref:polysaccharide biosynthesis tyrosine autokinase n=1 Tax=unclassified Lactococcus TaxID=2643510 RepID=UPI0011CB5089|nr:MULTISPECIES: polysaccharide biosynthesis tyrosine autokinase [unclassified Lactococcus]MQW22579.1 polysaccharide biosynthesis tyrosine autokinase [Lactococcus sp. dk101]TXK45602.1 polysaccharide biosynthesis tyrosine autokinase [Lactococcus sp. dk310]TXK51452.1 polysaccharide biosynthesis tyrosine autokinase [Lactococcus sp. dk322]